MAENTDIVRWGQAAYAVVKSAVVDLDLGSAGIVSGFGNRVVPKKYSSGWEDMIEAAVTTMIGWLYDELTNPLESEPIRYRDSFEREMFELRCQQGFDNLCEQLGFTPAF